MRGTQDTFKSLSVDEHIPKFRVRSIFSEDICLNISFWQYCKLKLDLVNSYPYCGLICLSRNRGHHTHNSANTMPKNTKITNLQKKRLKGISRINFDAVPNTPSVPIRTHHIVMQTTLTYLSHMVLSHGDRRSNV